MLIHIVPSLLSFWSKQNILKFLFNLWNTVKHPPSPLPDTIPTLRWLSPPVAKMGHTLVPYQDSLHQCGPHPGNISGLIPPVARVGHILVPYLDSLHQWPVWATPWYHTWIYSTSRQGGPHPSIIPELAPPVARVGHTLATRLWLTIYISFYAPGVWLR